MTPNPSEATHEHWDNLENTRISISELKKWLLDSRATFRFTPNEKQLIREALDQLDDLKLSDTQNNVDDDFTQSVADLVAIYQSKSNSHTPSESNIVEIIANIADVLVRKRKTSTFSSSTPTPLAAQFPVDAP